PFAKSHPLISVTFSTPTPFLTSTAPHNTCMKLEPRKLAGLLKACLLVLLSAISVVADAQSKRQTQLKNDLAIGDRIAEGVVFAWRLWLRRTTGKSLSGDYSRALVS